MKVLLVCASAPELPSFCRSTGPASGKAKEFAGHQLYPLVCGVGPAMAAFSCGRELALNRYDLVIHTGIAGSIREEVKPGEAVAVTRDQFYLLGSEDHDRFLSVFELGLTDANTEPYSQGKIDADPTCLSLLPQSVKQVEGITVQCVHGRQESIQRLKKAYPEATTESQEGASVMLAVRLSGLPCIQLRGISNRVEPRNREAWQIEPALNAVNQILIDFLNRIPLKAHERHC